MTRNLWAALGAICCTFATQTIAFVVIPLAPVGIGLPGFEIGLLVSVLAGLGLVTDLPGGVRFRPSR